MISDLYPPEKRTSAMATFVAGANVGILLAFVFGGVIGQTLGWRWAFVLAGLPGILLAIVMLLTVHEPIRRNGSVSRDEARSLFISAARAIWKDRGLFYAMAGLAVTGIVTFGALAWNATIIIRVHGLPQAQAGLILAGAIGVCGGLGTWLSGLLADRLGQTDPRWRMWIVVLAIVAAKPFVFTFLLSNATAPALTCFAVSAFLAGVYWAPTFAFLHSRVTHEVRPMATAIYIFAFNLVGVGVGPTAVGVMSDQLFSTSGQRSLALALFSMQALGLIGAWFYWQVSRTIEAKSPTSEATVSRSA